MKKIIIVLLVLCSVNIFSDTPAKNAWLFEYGVFQKGELSPENMHLISSIPLYFKQNTSVETAHRVTEEEKRGIQKLHLKKVVSRKKADLYNLIKARDELLFKEDKSTLESQDKKIEEMKRELSQLQMRELSSVSVPSEYYLEYFTPSEEQAGELLLTEKKSHEIKDYLLREEVDYFISGLVEQVGDIVFVTVTVSSRYSDEEVVLWKGVGKSEEILSYREDMLKSVLAWLPGKETASYTIKVTPSDAFITIDGDFKSMGEYSARSVDPGLYTINVHREGYYDRDIPWEIEAGEDNLLEVELKEQITGQIEITSEPPGADVWYGSRWVGQTPLTLNRLAFSQQLIIEKEGFMKIRTGLTPFTDETSLHFVLSDKMFDEQELLTSRQEDFYLSMGLFSLSLAGPLFFQFQKDAIAENAGPDTLSLLNSSWNRTDYGFWASTAVSAGLFSHMVYRLYKYLDAAEQAAG